MNKRHTPDTTQHEEPGATPASDLGELWQTLDVLPEAETPEDLLATTIEMVAVDGRHQRPGKLSRFAQMRGGLWQWFAPAIAVGVSIVLGYCVGQVTTGTSEREPVDWRARRTELLKSSIQEAIENNPSGAQKFFRQQLRNSQDAQGQTVPPQQNSTMGTYWLFPTLVTWSLWRPRLFSTKPFVPFLPVQWNRPRVPRDHRIHLAST